MALGMRGVHEETGCRSRFFSSSQMDQHEGQE